MIKFYLSKLSNQLKAISTKSIEYSDNIKNPNTIDYTWRRVQFYNVLCNSLIIIIYFLHIWRSIHIKCCKSTELTSVLRAAKG